MDGIPALINPEFEPVSQTRFLAHKAMIAVDLSGQPPITYTWRYLTRHEIMNDQINLKQLTPLERGVFFQRLV
jgi:hypothetical protein